MRTSTTIVIRKTGMNEKRKLNEHAPAYDRSLFFMKSSTVRQTHCENVLMVILLGFFCLGMFPF